MATQPRPLYPGAAYHVTVRRVDGAPLFLDDGFRGAFLDRLARSLEATGVVCDAYCLMTNHFHLLLRTPTDGLPQTMQRLNTWLAVTHNRQLGRRGRVLEAPYRTRLIERQEHLLEVARYIVLNPLRAGVVADPSDYCWSSYRATAGLAARPRFLTTAWLLGQLGGPPGYREFVAAGAGVRSLDELLLAAA